MSEPVDTKAEAVERIARAVESCDWTYLFNGDANGLSFREQVASLLRALARERTAAQQRIADLEAQCARVQRDAGKLPKEPSLGLLVSMSLRLDHGLLIPKSPFSSAPSGPEYVQAAIGQMRQLYEEASGHGFWSPENDCEYVAAYNAAMAAKGDDWLTREARQIGLHSPACVSFGQNECDCGAAMAAKGAG